MAGRGRPGPQGKIERLRSLLGDNARQVLDMVLDDTEATDLEVAQALTAWAADLPGAEDIGSIHRVTVNEWRRGQPRGAQVVA